MGRLKRLSKAVLVYSGIIFLTLLLLDITMMVTGLFPPTYDYGVPGLGWVAAPATGEIREDTCMEFGRNEMYHYTRNEDAYRTSRSAAELTGPGELFEIAVTGDSHTDLCAPNADTHFGVMEQVLSAAEAPTVTYAYGAGRYSPLQAYLAVRDALHRYQPDALVLNLYTGNDFYDILRVDDRPHFVKTEDGLVVEDPVWYQYDAPGLVRRSRVIFALRGLADATGIRGMLLRIRYLRATAEAQDQGLGAVIAYINDLRRSTAPEVGYPGAYAAQMLNQQLFFHRFPGTRDESMRRVRALLDLIRREHPDLLLVMSPIPSYQVVGELPVDPALLDLLDRLPITYEGGLAEEEALYRELGREAMDAGWLYVDNLSALRGWAGEGRLYNDFDYHIEPVASEIIGRAQAAAILPALRPRGAAADAP